ncbi:tail length tape measure protein [Bacillus sp. AFS023182]|uniref:phage tail protein n=1 Tax=Bacillus sp. AFS023182 TaxID=2033492 RepID=UPI000BF448C1|nr:tail length tape measure protein [Bacillus sp. AFS023182]PFD98924.1 tail length tape measure protein [Bacillus sp. AFS023182]
MADGRVEIDTRLDTGNIRRDVQRVNDELNHIGDGVAESTRGLTDEVGDRYDSLGRRIRYVYRGTSEEARRMYSEMASAHRQQSIAMRGARDQMVEIKYQYFKLAQSAQTYSGTIDEFMELLEQLGAEQKSVTDQMINANSLQMTSMLQTAATMMNMTTQAQRITQNYERMANPMYTVNRAGLAIANSMNQIANRGNAAVLALKMLGPTASMKSLLNMQAMINQGLMRFQTVALAAAATGAALYTSLFKAAAGPDPAEVRSQMAEVTAVYAEELDKRTNEIKNFANIFEEVQVQAVSPAKLMKNLQTQTEVLRNWISNLKELTARGVDEGLIKELQQMGPKAANEVAALTQMTQEGLNNYVALWREKGRLAKEQAIDELSQLKESTDRKIKELQDSLTPLGLAWERMKNAFVTAVQPMVEAFGMLMTPIVNFAAKFFELVTAFNEAHPKLALIIQAIIMLVPALTLLLSPLAIGIGLWNGMLAAWSSIWMLISPLVTGLMAMSGTVWLVSAAIVGLVAGIMYLWNTSEGFRNTVIAGWEAIKNAAITVWNFILNNVLIPIWDAISIYFKQILDKLLIWWNENGQMIADAAKNIWSFISSIVSGAMDAILGIMQFVWPVVKFLVEGTWEAIKNLINGAVNTILGIIKFFSALFTGNWSEMWEATKEIVFGALEFIWGYLQLFGVGKVLKFLGKWAGDVISKFSFMWTYIKKVWNDAIFEIWYFFATKFEAMSKFASSIGSSISSVFSWMWNIISSSFSSGLNYVGKIVWNGFKSILDFLTGLGTTFYNAGRGLIEMIAKGVMSAFGVVKDVINWVAQQIRNFLPFSPAKVGPLSDLDHLDFGGPISDSIELAFPKVQGLLNKMLTLPNIEQNVSSSSQRTNGNDNQQIQRPISLTLNYQGDNPQDAAKMMDIIEKELSSRMGMQSYLVGEK